MKYSLNFYVTPVIYSIHLLYRSSKTMTCTITERGKKYKNNSLRNENN